MATMNAMAVVDRGNTHALNVPGWIDARVLAANTNETHTVPAGAQFVIFSANGDFYARYDGNDAAVPSSDVTDGTASDLNPTMRHLAGVTEIDLIAPAATVVTMMFYS
jgi:hypothetical protein